MIVGCGTARTYRTASSSGPCCRQVFRQARFLGQSGRRSPSRALWILFRLLTKAFVLQENIDESWFGKDHLSVLSSRNTPKNCSYHSRKMGWRTVKSPFARVSASVRRFSFGQRAFSGVWVMGCGRGQGPPTAQGLQTNQYTGITAR